NPVRRPPGRLPEGSPPVRVHARAADGPKGVEVEEVTAFPRPTKQPKARKPLRRSRLRRKVPRRVERMTEDDRAFRAWTHTRACVGLKYLARHVCEKPIEQAHERDNAGIGLKAPERRSVAMD